MAENLQDARKRFVRETVILNTQLDGDLDDAIHLDLIVQQSKTVARASRLLVQLLAQRRDTYSREAQGTHDTNRD